MEIKVLLKEQRIKLGLTMAEVAQRVGVSEATISRWESGISNNMKQSNIKKISEVLNIPISKIISADDELTEDECCSHIQKYSDLTSEECKLIKAYRAASDDDRTAVNCILRKYREGGKFDAEFSEHIC